jgi:NADPH-dependent ferric siderophore reductase
MPNPFQTSTNALFDTRVARVLRLSPGFVRITLTGDGLERFADHGRDQRIKIMVPGGSYPAVFDAAALHRTVPHGTLLHETVWRQRWKDLPPSDRPVLRSYTPSAVRPSVREVDLDFYVHERPGPASSWAVGARSGERLLISGPDTEAGNPLHGIQWRPGAATRVLLAGDETAYPAIQGVAQHLPPGVSADVILEAGDPADVEWLASSLDGHRVTVCRRRGVSGGLRGGEALRDGVASWAGANGQAAAAAGEGFYAWLATESSQVARARDALHQAGISLTRIHAQGYWNDRLRTPVKD